MDSYDSELDLKAQVEKNLRWRLSDDRWAEMRDRLHFSHSPYDGGDVQEHVEMAKKLFAGQPAEEKEHEFSIRVPESHITVSGEIAHSFEWKAKQLRDFLGLGQPLKPEGLGEFLHGFQPTRGDETIILQYQEPDGSNGAVALQTPTGKAGQTHKLLVVKEAADNMVRRAGWYSPHATNFILCGQTPILPYLAVRKNFVYGNTLKQPSITLTIHDLNISAETVRKVYLKARNEMLAEYLGQPGNKSYKPRSPSKRILELLDFVSANEDLSWEKRFQKWNKEKGRTHGKYANDRSMQTAYSQAKKRLFG